MQTTSVLPLWLIPINSPLKEISSIEQKAADLLPEKRSREYKHARGYARYALSELFKIKPLDIPLFSSPGKAPLLGNDLGYLSFSHCEDALLIGWSRHQLGIDLERSDRNIPAERIVKRFFHKEEKSNFKSVKEDKLQLEVIKNWVVKEALIKWQKGKLSQDFREWSINYQSNLAIHRKLKCQVNFYQVNFQQWSIGIASNQKLRDKSFIICFDSNFYN